MPDPTGLSASQRDSKCATLLAPVDGGYDDDGVVMVIYYQNSGGIVEK